MHVRQPANHRLARRSRGAAPSYSVGREPHEWREPLEWPEPLDRTGDRKPITISPADPANAGRCRPSGALRPADHPCHGLIPPTPSEPREGRHHGGGGVNPRKDAKHPLSGLVGTGLLTDIAESLWRYLILGRWVHIGKGATFGQGRYEVLLQQDTLTQRATAFQLDPAH